MPLTVEQLRSGGYPLEVQVRENAPFDPAHVVFDRLYGGGKAQLFVNAIEIPDDPEGANENAIEALHYAVERIEFGEGLIGVVFGAMATAKSTFGVKLAHWQRQTQVFKHFGDKRGFENRLWIQGKGGMDTDVSATIYADFDGLLSPEIGIKFGETPIAFIDEVNFIGRGDPPEADKEGLVELVRRSRASGTKLVFSGLDFDFRAVPWPNTEMLLEVADMFVIVLGGRCSYEGCGHPSLLTQRNVIFTSVGERVLRPSHWGELVVQVGSVIEDEEREGEVHFHYSPRCMIHHNFWSPKKRLSLMLSMNRDSELQISALHEYSLDRGGLEKIFFVEVENLVGDDFDYGQFVEGAVKKWRPLLEIQPNGQVERQLDDEDWSPLVPQDLIPPKELIEEAWKSWEKVGESEFSYIITIGPIGGGKTCLAEALVGERDGVLLFEEEWRKNPHLTEFYELLGRLAAVIGPKWRSEDLEAQANSSEEIELRNLVDQIHQVQGRAQGWFAAKKFRQKLEAVVRLKEGIVLQDVGDVGDANYFIQQWNLGLASDRNRDWYFWDFTLRQRMAPLSVAHPIAFYPFVPFEELRKRIENVRGREFELGMPAGYLAANYLANAELAIALARFGHPVIMVDAYNNDYRKGEGAVLLKELWGIIDETHQQRVKGKFGE